MKVGERAEMAAASLVQNEAWLEVKRYFDMQNEEAVAALSLLNPASPKFMQDFHSWRDGVIGRVAAVNAIEKLAHDHVQKQKEQTNG